MIPSAWLPASKHGNHPPGAPPHLQAACARKGFKEGMGKSQKAVMALFLAQHSSLQAVTSPVSPTPPALGAEGSGNIW